MVDSTILSEPSSKLLNQIKLNQFDNAEFINLDHRPSMWHLSGLKPINLFTGENNSRKSRLLRAIFEKSITDFETDLFSLDDMAKQVLAAVVKKKNALGIHNVGYISDFANNIHEQIHSANLSYTSTVRDIAEIVGKFIANRYGGSLSVDSITKVLRPDLENLLTETKSLFYNGVAAKPYVYIPMLRGLRPLDLANPKNDLYQERTIKDYFDDSRRKDIFTGTSLYQELTEHLLGNHDQRELIRKYEAYLSKTFFQGRDIALVPKLTRDVVSLKLGDTEDNIFDLGDGIQSIIILTFKVFTATQPTVFFIEEPEQHLHAGMQRVLIDAFSQFKQHMYFMTTHSNHLLDIAQEQENIAVHRIANKTDAKASEITPLTEFSDALTDLGVRASSVLLANCSIWVEGVTDKMYLRVYLEKFLSNLENSSSEEEQSRAKKLRQYKENLHYIFTEYQGSNITHWDFADSTNSADSSTPAKMLNNKIFLLADGDIAGKGDRVEELTEKLGDKFFQLKSKEIENQIPFDVLVKTAENRWKTFNGRSGLVFNVQNIKANENDFFQVSDKGIGAMLELYVRNQIDGSRKGIEKNFFRTDSGTIKDKVKFCHAAVSIMEDEEFTWELTPDLNDLCEAIWTHIEESN